MSSQEEQRPGTTARESFTGNLQPGKKVLILKEVKEVPAAVTKFIHWILSALQFVRGAVCPPQLLTAEASDITPSSC